MGRQPDTIDVRRRLINSFVVLGASALLVYGDWSASLSRLTKSGIVAMARACGLESQDTSTYLQIGQVRLEWVEACSGISILTVLCGIVVWADFSSPTRRLAWRFAIVAPLALLANTLRVGVLTAYRHWVFPAWEGEHVHTLIGLLSAAPFAYLLVTTSARRRSVKWSELLYLIAILAALSSAIDDPGGPVVLLCSLIALAPLAQQRAILIPTTWVVVAAWLLLALPIATTSAESLWLPWMLLCPGHGDRRSIDSLVGWITLAGTIPILAAQPLVQLAVAGAIAWRCYDFVRQRDRVPIATSTFAVDFSGGLRHALAVSALFVPALVPDILLSSRLGIAPPRGVMTQPIGTNAFRLRFAGQPKDVALFWYGGNEHGRHHSVRNCLEHRGVNTRWSSASNEVLIADGKWIREFFILDTELLASYSGYASTCFPPITSHGVHIIIQSPMATVDQDYFILESERLARLLFEAHLERAAAQHQVLNS